MLVNVSARPFLCDYRIDPICSDVRDGRAFLTSRSDVSAGHSDK